MVFGFVVLLIALSGQELQVAGGCRQLLFRQILDQAVKPLPSLCNLLCHKSPLGSACQAVDSALDDDRIDDFFENKAVLFVQELDLLELLKQFWVLK